MDAKDWSQIESLAVESAESLLAAYGVTLHAVGEAVPHPVEPPAHLVVMGFGGEALRGSLLLKIDPAVLARAHAGAFVAASRAAYDPWDWACELANQLLGRIKNRLFGVGVVVQLSTPTAVSGHEVRSEPTSPDRFGLCRLFVSDEGAVRVRLDVIAEPGVSLEAPRFGDDVMVEGEVLLF